MFSFKTYLIVIFYMLGAIFLKETHPFSRFPMYNAFPNWSYVFYLTNEKKALIPSMTHFNITGGWIGHTFYAICQSEGINYGNNMETKEELSLIGEKMFEQITKNNKSFLENIDTLYLYKTSFSIQNEEIIKKDVIIYEYYNQ